MAEQKIELRKIRDFGENMNDTFLFIRQNFGPLMKSFLAICAVFMLTQAILSGFFQYRAIAFIKGIVSGGRIHLTPVVKLFIMQYSIVLLSALLAIVSMSVALGAYIKYYVQNAGVPPSIEDIWTIFKKYFFKVFVYGIPVYFLTIIGYFFCVLPGIYLSVALVPFSLVVMIEDRSFSDSFRRCFELIRDNFWSSFAIYLVAYIIFSLCGFVIGTIITAVSGLGGFLTTEDYMSHNYAILSSFLNIFSFCFYIIFFVSVALNYFNLVETKDGTGILNRIDNIGKNRNNFDNREEEY